MEYFKKMRQLRFGISAPDMGILYTGVDIAKNSIAEAKKINPSEFNFFAEDALKFFKTPFHGEFDVVLFRHPGAIEMSDDGGPEAPLMWKNMMRVAYNNLSPDGILIVSTLQCSEYLFVQDLFKNEFGATVYATGQNPYSYEWGRDAYLVVVGKPKPSHTN